MLGVVEAFVDGPGAMELGTVPHGAVVVSVQLGATLASHEKGGVVRRRAAWTGLRDSAIRYEAPPGTHSVVALLAPWAACALARGAPLGHFADRRLDLADVLSPRCVAEIEDRLHGSDPDQRGRAFASWLEARTAAVQLPDVARRTFAVADALMRDSFDDLETHLSVMRLPVGRRQIERDLARWIGLSAKGLIELGRMQRVLRRIRAGEGLARVAAVERFADQAQLTRITRRVLGETPGQLRRAGWTELGRAYERASGGLLVTR